MRYVGVGLRSGCVFISVLEDFQEQLYFNCSRTCLRNRFILALICCYIY